MPWKSSTQLARRERRSRRAPSSGRRAARRAARRPARSRRRRAPRRAAAPVEAAARGARRARRARKWSGAPPRSPSTVSSSVAERAAADEERERLVLVRRPGGQPDEQERRDGDGARADAEPERRRADERRRARSARNASARRLRSGPIPSRRSTLLAFRADADLRVPLPERARLRALPADDRRRRRRSATICGEAPLERVLYPVAVHFKGSGFYSTDYGRGGAQAERRRRTATRRRRRRRAPDERADGRRSDAGREGRRSRPPTATARSAARGPRRRRSRARRRPGAGRAAAAAPSAPVNIAITFRFSSVADDDRLAADRCGVAAEPAVERRVLRRAEADPAELQRTGRCVRSVASGFSRSSPMNGSFERASRRSSACRAIACEHLLLALAARDVGLGRVELVLADARVDSARRPSMCCLPLPKRQPCQLSHSAAS